MPEGMSSLEQQLPTREWEKPTADFHKDPRMMADMRVEEVDPLAEARHQAILDQISKATPEELAIIQKNKATALDGKWGWMEDQKIVDIVNAVYQRSQELIGPKETVPNNPETLH